MEQTLEVKQGIHLTPLERLVMYMTADGEPHTREELLKCWNDSEASFDNLNNVIYTLRKKIRPIGQDIICRAVKRGLRYQRVVLLTACHCKETNTTM